MTSEQLQGRQVRLVRELALLGGLEPPPVARIVRLARDLAETQRLIGSAPTDQEQAGFGVLLSGAR
ncbi:MAG: hypothetical protein M3O01_02585 [Pseudomonadota bacterium]|nr:hypothetical protein [Pseudomonadota bacterium]